jgi:hypothetical protein
MGALLRLLKSVRMHPPTLECGLPRACPSTLMIADNGLWRRSWPADPIGGRGALYGGYEVQEAGLERRSTISHPRVGPHDLVSFGAASV